MKKNQNSGLFFLVAQFILCSIANIYCMDNKLILGENTQLMTACYLNQNLNIGINKALESQQIPFSVKLNDPCIMCSADLFLSDNNLHFLKEQTRRSMSFFDSGISQEMEEQIAALKARQSIEMLLPISLFEGKKNGDSIRPGMIIGNQNGTDFCKYVNRCAVNFRSNFEVIAQNESQIRTLVDLQIIDHDDNGNRRHGREGCKSRNKFIMQTTTPNRGKILPNKLMQ